MYDRFPEDIRFGFHEYFHSKSVCFQEILALARAMKVWEKWTFYDFVEAAKKLRKVKHMLICMWLQQPEFHTR